MEFLVVFLLFLLLILAALLIGLQKKIKNRENEISRLRKKISDELAYPQFVLAIIKHPDPFVELLRFSHLSQNNIPSKDLSSLLNFFFQELAIRGRLEMIGQYKEVVEFSNDKHRSSEIIKVGEKVEVVVPGWKYNNNIIRYAMVQKTKRGKNG